MKAVILSCGEGKRLNHLGYKPTLPFGETSVLGHIMEGFKRVGLDDVMAFTRPESDDINKILGSYNVLLFHRRTPNAFVTFKEFAKIAKAGESYLIFNSDVVFDEGDFGNFINVCRRIEKRGNFQSFIIWISKMKGVGVSIEEGEVSCSYGEKVKAPVVKYSKTAKAPIEFTSVIYPYGSLKLLFTVEKSLESCNNCRSK